MDQCTQDARPEDMSPEQLRTTVTMLRVQVEAERARANDQSDLAGRLERKWERAAWERDVLQRAIERIANDPHQAYDWMGDLAMTNDAERQYQVGACDGHRCAAGKAREALAMISPTPSEGDPR